MNPTPRTYASALAAIFAVITLVAVTAAAPAAALPYPVADPGALPDDTAPGPDTPMRKNSTECTHYTATPDFDPATVSAAQNMLDLPQAWKTSQGNGVTVAVIDSGITPGPRLPRLTGGGDYIVAAENGLVDCDGHGTAVAAIIAATPTDTDAFTGVAPKHPDLDSANLRPVQPPNHHPQQRPQPGENAGTIATLARAIRHAADIDGVGVINLSVATCFPAYRNYDQAGLGAALRYAAIDKNIVIIAAAANTGQQPLGVGTCNPNPPPSKTAGGSRDWASVTTISTPCYWQPYLLCVGALADDGGPSHFTMTGPWVGIAAPGEHITSLANTPDTPVINAQPTPNAPPESINGTSFAAAYTSGVAALLRATYPQLSAHQIIYRLLATAHNPAQNPSEVVGAGIIDPVAALTWHIPPTNRQPTHAPTTHITAPPPPPPNHRGPTLITLAAAALLAATATTLWATRQTPKRRTQKHTTTTP